jgi:diguanylate cyclase (GGDEF)-like protein/PAS domain S-box-containing protein
LLETFDARYEPLFAFYPYGIARIDRDGIILEANAALAERSGYPARALLGHHVREFATPETAASADELVQELRAGKTAWRELRLRHKSGTPLARRCTVVPSASPNEGREGFIVIQDISSEVHAQQFMRSLFEHHPHGIARLDLDGTVLEVNDALVEISGYDRDELIGTHFMEFAGPQTGAVTAQLLEETFKGSGQTAPVHPIRKDGSRGSVQLTTIPVRIDARVAGAFLVFDTQPALLRESQQDFQSLFTRNPDAVIALDRDGLILSANDALVRLGGYPREQIIGQDFRAFMSAAELEVVGPYIARVLTGETVSYEFTFVSQHKGPRILLVTSFPMTRDDDIVGYYAIMVDATDARAAKKRADEQSNRIRELYVLAASANIADSQVNTMLEAGCRLLNMEVAAIVACAGDSRIDHRIDLHPSRTASESESLLELAAQVHETQKSITVTPAQEMRACFRTALAVPLVVAGQAYGALCFAGTLADPPALEDTDVDLAALISALLGSALERRRSRANLRTLAYFDSLTGLPNRLFLQERLRDALESAQMNLRRVALIFFDLDRFKDVNDTLGHALGDRLLQVVAARLIETVRDRGIVARMGGDEFAVLLPNCESIDEIRKAAEELLDVIDDPYHIDEYEQYVTASAGVSVYPDDGKDDHALVKNADIAMYRAKDLGRNAFQLYAPSLEATIQMRLSQEKLLRHALGNNEFVVYYQPQVDMLSGKIVTLEALVRWNHPKTGIIFPGRFIPSAEISGLIVPLGDWVLRAATVQTSAWQEEFPGLRIAVNLSAKQFHQPDLRAQILSALQAANLSPNLLEMEITESVAMTDAAASIQIMRELVDSGVGIGLDDFGTGYSSLSYLRLFPAAVLKIDRTFVSGIGTEANDETIVITVIAMAHNLGLEVVAEGVETAEQYDFLRTYGCDRVQGYYISPAVPAAGITELLKEWRPHPA